MMNCPFCGSQISTESTFCPYCGQKIVRQTPPQPDPAEEARRQQEEAARRQQEEAARIQREQEEAARRQQEEAAARQRAYEQQQAYQQQQQAYQQQQQAYQQQAYQQPYNQGPQGPGVPPVPPFPPTSYGSSEFSVVSILTEGIPLGIKNFVTIFGAAILWLLTFWIPYLNVGTTIAVSTMPMAIADNESPEGPTYIFDSKYRKYMGEYFILIGLMYMAIWTAYCFLIIPGIVIGLAWSQALYLLFDKQLNPIDALKESNEKTCGHKWTLFFVGLVFNMAFFILAFILLWIFIQIGVTFLVVIAVILLVGIYMVGSVGINAVIYRKLCK